jgi:hypothetical protein
MDLDFLEGLAPELKSWLTDRGGYLFEERPEAVHSAAIGLRAAYGDEGSDNDHIWRWADLRKASGTLLGGGPF